MLKIIQNKWNEIIQNFGIWEDKLIGTQPLYRYEVSLLSCLLDEVPLPTHPLQKRYSEKIMEILFLKKVLELELNTSLTSVEHHPPPLLPQVAPELPQESAVSFQGGNLQLVKIRKLCNPLHRHLPPVIQQSDSLASADLTIHRLLLINYKELEQFLKATNGQLLCFEYIHLTLDRKMLQLRTDVR